MDTVVGKSMVLRMGLHRDLHMAGETVMGMVLHMVNMAVRMAQQIVVQGTMVLVQLAQLANVEQPGQLEQLEQLEQPRRGGLSERPKQLWMDEKLAVVPN